MAQNLVVQLLLKTGTFSTDLKTARGQVQNFQKGCQTAGKSLDAFGSAMGINIGALTKFGGAIGAAALAGKGLKEVLMSTQTTADAFEGAIAGCQGVIDALKVSLATADFSVFQNGLWGVFDAAKAARDAIDDLQDAQLAYDYKTAKNRREAREAEVDFKKPGATPAQREEARARWEQSVINQETYADNYSYKNLNAIRGQVVSRNPNINKKNVTLSIIERAMDIQLGLEGDTSEVKKKIKERADFIKKEAKKYATDSKREQYYSRSDIQRDLILDALLQMPDKTINAVISEAKAGEIAKDEAASMRKAYDRAIKGSLGSGSGTKPKKEELPVDEGSLTYWQNILAEETKYRDALVKDTDEWKSHNEKVEEAKAKIEEIQGKLEKSSSVMEGSLTWYKQILTETTKLRDETEYGTDAWDKYNEKVKTASLLISLMERDAKLDEALAVDPPTIESLQTILSILQQMRNQTAIDSEEFKELSEMIDALQTKLNKVTGATKTATAPETDSWDKFNQAMANTSTIVSSLTNTFKENSEVTATSILQMVATTLPAIGSLISAIGALTTAEAVEAGVGAVGKAVSTSKHWIEAIAAVASLGAVVAAAIGSAQKVQKFANGGIVGGSSFTGDRVVANVNSGEMILNRQQQVNLFRMANGGGTGNQVEFHISGTDLVGVLNNNNRKNRLIK